MSARAFLALALLVFAVLLARIVYLGFAPKLAEAAAPVSGAGCTVDPRNAPLEAQCTSLGGRWECVGHETHGCVLPERK